MTANDPAPTLLRFMHGDKAAHAQRGASPRLLLWCAAFDDWLAECRRKYRQDTCKAYANAWKKLLQRLPVAPWELTPADIKCHVQWLQGLGRAPITIRGVLTRLSRFYAWCDSHRIDPLCMPGFDPTAGVPRPRIEDYARAQALTPQEARRLLVTLKQDPCSLSRRDYAFFLARLSLGVSLTSLKQLQWGQIREDPAGAWVDWGHPRPPELLPPEVWAAILDYLEASGRVGAMRPESYIFAPLAGALLSESSDKAEDWNDRRCQSNTHIERTLKIYGRLAAIPQRKLTLQALRHTAALLRLEAGDSAEQIQAFLGRARLNGTRYYLRLLTASSPPGDARQPDAEPQPPAGPPLTPAPIRDRRPHWATQIHGCFSKRQPPAEQLAEILAEGCRGLGDEIAGLRLLARLLLELQGAAVDPDQLETLIAAYGSLASQIGELVRTEKKLSQCPVDDHWEAQILAIGARMAQEDGEVLEAGAVPDGADLGPQLDLFANELVEEIAALRLSLRRLFDLVQTSRDIAKILRLAELAGLTATRLARLLKAEVARAGEAQAEQIRIISTALEQVARDLDL